MSKVVISVGFDYIRVDAGYWAVAFHSVEDEFPLALRPMLGPRHAGAIPLEVHDGSTMHPPAHRRKPLPCEVKPIYVAADVQVSLLLGYTVPVGPEDTNEAFPLLGCVAVLVDLAYKAAICITEAVGSYAIRGVCDDYVEVVSGRVLAEPFDAVSLEKGVAVGSEGESYLFAERDVLEPFFFPEVRFPRFIEALRAFEVGGLYLQEGRENDLSSSSLSSSGLS